MRDAESRFVRSTRPARRPVTRTFSMIMGPIALLFALSLSIAFGPGSASAAYIHPEPTYEFGPTGLPGSSFPGSGTVAEMDFDQSSKRLFVLNKSDSKVYGVHFAGPGSYAEVGPPFPLAVSSAGCCTEIAIDNTAGSTAENLYYTPDSNGAPMRGFTPAGAPLPAFALEDGEKCGVGVDNEGHVWSGNFSTRKIEEFNATGGAPIATVDVGGTGSPCRVRFDLSNNDMYVSQYFGQGAVRYTAASGYSAASAKPFDPTANTKIAINASKHVVYVAGNEKVSAYDTASGSLLEIFGESGCNINGIAVDDATDTVFLSRSCTNKIQEWRGTVVPDAVTGDPTGNTTVSGSIGLAGSGEVTDCQFEFGETTGYGQSRPCSPAAPYNADQTLVTADLKADLEGEKTYHYRITASNSNGTARGADKTITPHNVKELTTDEAIEITQESATLNAHFEGTNEGTFYYFEYGRTTGYGKKTAIPPGDDLGVTTGPTEISKQISELSQGVTYHFRVVAQNDLGISKGNDRTFTTYAAPTITSFTTKAVTETTADIFTTINPNGFESEYRVEYGPSLEYGQSVPVPSAVLVAGSSPEAVTVHLTGLNGGTYHFRVIAQNKWGTTSTGDQTFNFFPSSCPNATLRQQNGSSELPDCRAYELVSPRVAGNILLQTFAPPAPYATNPPRFMFAGYDGVIEGTNPTNSVAADYYVATRTVSGWKTTYPGIPGNEVAVAELGVGNRSLDKFLQFKNLKLGCCLFPFAYNIDEQFLGRWPESFASVPGGAEAYGAFQPSPDFSHLAFSTRAQFDPEGVTTYPGSVYDYDVDGNTVSVVSKVSKTAGGGDIKLDPAYAGSKELIGFPGVSAKFYAPFGSNVGADVGGNPAQMYPGVSIDGSHILMETKGVPSCGSCPTPYHLYMRVDDLITYEIAGGNAVNYVGMTSDGSRVIFTSALPLTDDDHDSSVDMFAWSEKGEMVGEPLSRVSMGPEDRGNDDSCGASWVAGCDIEPVNGSGPADYPIATNSDEVYFYSPEVLDSGEEGLEGGRNLYLYQGGHIEFVAALSSSGDGSLSRIQVSPQGDHAAFVTMAKLTDFENEGFAEMYTFDPVTREIACSSCSPRGIVPTSNVRASISGLFMSDDGRTAFATKEALVPRDTNNGSDVYEYVDGRPQLISTGTGEGHIEGRSNSEQPLSLMGISPNGVDIYFDTFDTLVTEDQNGAFLKFYDARAGGGFAVKQLTPPCEAADECHGPGSSRPAPAAIRSNGDLGSDGNWTHKAKHKKRHHRGKGKKAKHRKSAVKRHGGRTDG